MLPSVSIVIPAYNARDVLPICLDALFGQAEHPDHTEIIVVDDASTDDTVALAEARIPEAERCGYRLTVLRQATNAGPAAARNLGAEDASGDVVLFTDSDCEPLPHWLGEMLRPFADPNVSAVKGAYLTRQPEMAARFAQAEFEERYRMLERAEEVDVVFSYSAAFRRAVFRELNGFDTRFPVADNEDTDLSWRLVQARHKIAFNPKAHLYHRHPPSFRTYLRKKISRGYWRLVVYRKFPEKAVKDSYTPQGLKLQILLAGLMWASVVVGLFAPALWVLGAGLAIVFLLTTLPFVRALLGRDPALALLAPLLLFGRATAIGFGVLKAVPRVVSRDPLSDSAKPT